MRVPQLAAAILYLSSTGGNSTRIPELGTPLDRLDRRSGVQVSSTARLDERIAHPARRRALPPEVVVAEFLPAQKQTTSADFRNLVKRGTAVQRNGVYQVLRQRVQRQTLRPAGLARITSPKRRGK